MKIDEFYLPILMIFFVIIMSMIAYKDIELTNKVIESQDFQNKQIQTIYNRVDALSVKFNINESLGGIYFKDSKNIIIYTNEKSPKLKLEHSLHELGHYIWYQYTDDKFRYDYSLAYSRSDVYVSEYATTSHEEDFAENIAYGYFNISMIPKDRRELIEDKLELFK